MRRNDPRHGRHDHDPFTDLLFDILLGFTFLFMITVVALNPPAKQGNIEAKAEMIITTTWADGSTSDIDTWIEAPDGEVIWFRNPDVGLMHLDRDDRGTETDTIVVDGKTIVSPLNQEVVTVRGVLPGEYVVNVQYYKSPETPPPPMEVSVNVVKVNPVLEVVYHGTVKLPSPGAELTVVRFKVGVDGRVHDIGTLPKNLVKS